MISFKKEIENVAFFPQAFSSHLQDERGQSGLADWWTGLNKIVRAAKRAS